MFRGLLTPRSCVPLEEGGKAKDGSSQSGIASLGSETIIETFTPSRLHKCFGAVNQMMSRDGPLTPLGCDWGCQMVLVRTAADRRRDASNTRIIDT